MQFDGLLPTINTFQKFISISFESVHNILELCSIQYSDPTSMPWPPIFSEQKTRHEANTMTHFLKIEIELHKS